MKAQVLAGGRGKGHFDTGFQGGVHVADSKEQVVELSKQMIGHTLITKQTGAEGRPCNMVHIAETVDIAKEFYFAVLMDRASAGPMVVGSSEGGMNIEEVRAARAIGRCNTTHDAGVSPGLHWVHAHVYPCSPPLQLFPSGGRHSILGWIDHAATALNLSNLPFGWFLFLYSWLVYLTLAQPLLNPCSILAQPYLKS